MAEHRGKVGVEDQVPFILSQIEDSQAPLGAVEVHGLSAGAFDPELWQRNQLHWVPDARTPTLAPRMGGVFRNIYAPSAIDHGDHWTLYYSAWDGVDTNNDRCYCVDTRDFIDFDGRRTFIEHGDFYHVSNINVQKLDDGSLRALATCYPWYPGDDDSKGTNKPISFYSPDGRTWNGSPAPYHAQRKDVVSVSGYGDYENGDLNGANVLLHENGRYFLYFTNWRDRGKLYWAHGDNGKDFALGGLSLETEHAVNDVKRFSEGRRNWYVMALHKKGDVGLTARDTQKLWYSLSNDGKTFGEQQRLPGSRGEVDRNIFAVGFVARQDRICGVLYGAGPSAKCNRNQIFGYWLQKRVLLTAKPDYYDGNGAEYEAEGALGPDRQWIRLPLDSLSAGLTFEGTLSVFAEDAATPIGAVPVSLEPGKVYQLKWR